MQAWKECVRLIQLISLYQCHHACEARSMMTLTVVRDILLDSGIVLLIQDIFSRNERFVHNGNLCKCSLLISLFYDECHFFRDSFEPFHALLRAFSCIVGKPRCSAKHPLFQCRCPSVFNINHGDCSPHHAGSVADSHECSSERFLYVHELAIDNTQVQYRAQSWQEFTIYIVNWRSPLGLTACKFRNAYATGACILGKASLSCHEHPESH